MSRKDSWIPAFAGMTEQGTLSTVSFAGVMQEAILSTGLDRRRVIT